MRNATTFKADRLQMIVVAKNLSVLQLFISRMPKPYTLVKLRLEFESRLFLWLGLGN